MWIEHGGHNGTAYYRLEQKDYNDDNDNIVGEYSIYKSNCTHSWDLFTSLDHSTSSRSNDKIDSTGVGLRESDDIARVFGVV